MLKALSVIALSMLVLACSPGKEESARAPHEDLEFFNPPYVMPESYRDQTCVVDAMIGEMREKAFNAALDRIIEHTDAGILYSDMMRRDRVVYVAPVACDLLSGEEQYSAGAYFDTVLSEKHKPAVDNPFIVNEADLDYDNLVADLDKGAVAVDLTYPETEGKEEAFALFEKILCVADDNNRLQKKYGLPLLQISSQGDGLQYIYNMETDDTGLVVWLAKHGLRACGLDYQYTVRKLNEKERARAAAVFVERK